MPIAKNILLLLVLAFVINACNNNPPKENKVTVTMKQIDLVAPLVDSVETTSLDNSNQPSRLFIDMTNYLDSIGFTYDTMRIKKVNYFNNHDCFISDTKVFYNLTPKKTMVFSTLRFIQTCCNIDTATINFSVFKPVKNIYGYFYSEKIKSDDFICDGVIEEWQFSSDKEADNAAIEINRIKRCVYFNTASYLSRYGKSLFIFHTRASGFSHILKKTVNRFKNNFNIIYPTLDWDGARINE
ncbi:MAG TPA: hypothetical protein VKG26_11545 [Bacteroidia bacterium]|nr:hypothetical protein [Bacteroidia bacterium]